MINSNRRNKPNFLPSKKKSQYVSAHFWIPQVSSILRSQLVYFSYLKIGAMHGLKGIQWFLKKKQNGKDWKGKRKRWKKCHLPSLETILAISIHINSLSFSPKQPEKQRNSSISKINQQDDFWSLLNRFALSQGHREEMCCIPLTTKGSTSFFTKRFNLVKQRSGRYLFCLLHTTPSQLFSSREKKNDECLEFWINRQIGLCSFTHC